MAHDEPEDRLLALLALAFLVLLFGLTAWHLNGRERVPGVFTYQIGLCDVDWYGERQALAVACPGQDLIRVWPLPVEPPWWGDLMVCQSGPMWTLDHRSERIVCHSLTGAGQSRAFGRPEEGVL